MTIMKHCVYTTRNLEKNKSYHFERSRGRIWLSQLGVQGTFANLGEEL